MRRLYLIMLIFCVAVGSWAQTQQGTAYRYNGKKARTPLGNVTISYDANRRTVISNEKDGTFSLTLVGRKMGDRIGVVTVKKREMMVFNQQAVDEWSIRKEPLMLILCNADEFEKQKEDLIAIGRREAKKKYDKQKAELEAQLNASKIKETEYEEALDKAYEELEILQKNMDKYVDAFVRIDLSEVSAEEQRILDMVNEGRIDEAVDAYEKLDISGKLRQARENKKALSEAKSKIEEEEMHQAQVIEELIAKQQREIATLTLAGGKDNFDKISRMLKENAMADTADYNAAYRYANFAEQQADIDEAERFYLICLNNCPKELQIKLHVVVGNFFEMIRKETLAETHFLAAMEMAHEQGDFDWEDIIRNNLGHLYYTLLQFDKAEIYYKKCLDYRTKKLEQEPSEENISSLVTTQTNMGFLYASKEDSAKAEYYLYSALKYCDLLYKQNPNQYRDMLANVQLKNAQYYLRYCSLDVFGLHIRIDDSIMEAKTDSFLCSALENYRILYNQEPDVYRGILSDCLNRMGDFYKIVEESEKALEFYKEALDLENLRFKNNPRRYQESLSVSYNKLGNISKEMEDTVNAEKYYLAALNIYEELYKGTPYLFMDNMRTIYRNLCGLYKDLKDSVNYEKYLIQIIKLEDTKLKNDPSDSYNAISSREDLGRFYVESGRLNEAKSVFEQVCQIDSTQNVKRNMADCYRYLGETSTNSEDCNKAKEYLYMAIDYYKSYQKESGDNYTYDRLGKVHYLLGENYWMEKDTANTERNYLESLDYYALFYQKYPNLKIDLTQFDLLSCQYHLGNLYKEKEDYVNAEKYFLIALKKEIQLFNKGLELHRENIASLRSDLGDIYYITNNNVKAEEFYLQALDNYAILFNDAPETNRSKIAWIQYSLMYIYAKDHSRQEQYDVMLDAALTNYEALFQRSNSYLPTIVDLRKRKGWRYLQTGKIDEAVSLFESSYKLSPEKSIRYLVTGYNAKAYEYAKAGDYTQAIETIDKAISLKQDDANLYDSKGEILLMKGNQQGALEMWLKVMELDSDFLSKHHGTTELYRQLKERRLVE